MEPAIKTDWSALLPLTHLTHSPSPSTSLLNLFFSLNPHHQRTRCLLSTSPIALPPPSDPPPTAASLSTPSFPPPLTPTTLLRPTVPLTSTRSPLASRPLSPSSPSLWISTTLPPPLPTRNLGSTAASSSITSSSSSRSKSGSSDSRRRSHTSRRSRRSGSRPLCRLPPRRSEGGRRR